MSPEAVPDHLTAKHFVYIVSISAGQIKLCTSNNGSWWLRVCCAGRLHCSDVLD